MRKHKRDCIDCGASMRVTNTITTSASEIAAQRLQKIKCPNCGRCGTVQVTEKVDWLPKAKRS